MVKIAFFLNKKMEFLSELLIELHSYVKID